MKLLQPIAPPFDPSELRGQPFAERAKKWCGAWALQGYGTPLSAYAFYVLKLIAYVGGWIFFCSFTPGLGGVATIADWGLNPIAFQKAILWSMLFEGMGLGCGSGPLTGRYAPPIGGVLYFLRPGTTKLPLFPGLPVLGTTRRTWLDVALYLALLVALLRILIAPAPDPHWLLAIAVLVPVLGISDRTVFLACRPEHYWTTVVCFAFAGNWIAGAKAVQLALWFWAGFSKLNHHFPSVVCVMTSNGPLTRWPWLRRRMYRDFPDDLRPSRLAVLMAHAGTALELSVAIVLLLSPGGPSLVLGMVLVLVLHGFITSSVPMAVPIEWNVMVVYGAFALFWAHPEVSPFAVGSLPLAIFLLVMLVALPLIGNLFPSRLSFLMCMRYYAGNWAFSGWLFRRDSHKRLACLTKPAPWVSDQLDHFYDKATADTLGARVLAFRLMHLHGRALPVLFTKAVPRIEDYDYIEGEIVAGLVLGWNFGDGHLHAEQLLAAVQEQCEFEPGELRCIFIEAQPLGRSTMDYRIVDAKTGMLERGRLNVAALRARQPWSTEAFPSDT